jgi:transcriptional regulator with GAF, ATPase, and Fis domain
MAIRAWVHCVGPDREGTEKEIVSFLAEHGIEIRNFDPYLIRDYGVLLFGEFSVELCEFLREASPACRERILAGSCAQLSAEHAWKLMQAGAADVLNCRQCLQSAPGIIARLMRWETVDRMMMTPRIKYELIGASPVWNGILRQIVEVAHFTDAPVLILGESGTGKELIARLIHDLDARSAKTDLVVLDCSTVMPELSGSEFFGHERGAFTGAVSARDGAFALANGGTLFLDEVGELPLHLQSQLLRVIQEQTFKRVGGNAWQRTRFRLVCATNRDLWALVQQGEFRADLYYRIAGFVCHLPPLRERLEDVIPLARHFLKELRPATDPPELDPPVQEYLLHRTYPGNVRDLRQVIARMLCRYPGQGPLTVGCIPPDERMVPREDDPVWPDAGFELAIRRALSKGVGLKGISRMAEETAIRLAVGEAEGNLQQAALRLNVTDRTLQMRRAARRQEG